MLEVSKGSKLSDLSLFNPLAFLLFSINFNDINPQNNIKLLEEPKSQVTLCNIDP
jgi:hypothetical protein